MAAAPCPAALCRLRTRLTRSGTLGPPIMTLTLIRPLKLIEHSFLLRSSLLLKNQLRRTCHARAHAVPVALCRAVRHRFACSCFIYCSSFIPPLPPRCKRAKAQWNRALRGLRCQSFLGPAGRTSTRAQDYRMRELTAFVTFGISQYDMPRCSIDIRIELQR